MHVYFFFWLRFQTVLGLRRTVVCLIKDSLDVCKSWLLTDSRLVLYEVRSHVTYRKAAMPLDELIGRAVKRVAVEIIFIQLSWKRTFAFCIESCSRLPCNTFVFSRRKEMWNITAFSKKGRHSEMISIICLMLRFGYTTVKCLNARPTIFSRITWFILDKDHPR